MYMYLWHFNDSFCHSKQMPPLISDFDFNTKNCACVHAQLHVEQVQYYSKCFVNTKFSVYLYKHKQLSRANSTCRLCLSSFPRVEARFNTHYQNAYMYMYMYANAFLQLLRLSSISQYREYESRGRPCHCLHCAVWSVDTCLYVGRSEI